MENSLNTEYLMKSAESLPCGNLTGRQASKDRDFTRCFNVPMNSFEVKFHKDISHSISLAKKSLPKVRNLTSLLSHIVFHLLSHYDEDRDYHRVLVFHMLFVPKGKDSILEKLLQEQLAIIAYIIELSKGKKIVAKDVDSHQAAFSFFFIYLGVLISFLSDPRMTVDDALDQFSASSIILQRGIEKEKDCGNDQKTSSFIP